MNTFQKNTLKLKSPAGVNIHRGVFTACELGAATPEPDGGIFMTLKSSFQKPHYVYALIDADTLQEVYIGCTCDIYKRRRLHFSNCKSQTNIKLKEYLLNSKKVNRWPIFKVISSFENYENAHKFEVQLIKKIHPKFNIDFNN